MSLTMMISWKLATQLYDEVVMESNGCGNVCLIQQPLKLDELFDDPWLCTIRMLFWVSIQDGQTVACVVSTPETLDYT